MIDGKNLKSDVLKAGYHGSRTSTSGSFMISCLRNTLSSSHDRTSEYGHPHKEVLDILEKIKATILKTYELGTISFSSDREKIITSLWL